MKAMFLRIAAVTVLAICGVPFRATAAQGDNQQQAQPPAAPPQDAKAPEAQPPAPKPQFFAGTLTAVESDYIIVSRRLVGKAPESRTFVLQPQTKTNHPLRPKQRVTVRYRHQDEGDIALEVLVRQQRTPAKTP